MTLFYNVMQLTIIFFSITTGALQTNMCKARTKFQQHTNHRNIHDPLILHQIHLYSFDILKIINY